MDYKEKKESLTIKKDQEGFMVGMNLIQQCILYV